MKKMYNQPQTDVVALNTERLMDTATMSSAGSGGGGKTEAPVIRSVAPAVPGDAL